MPRDSLYKLLAILSQGEDCFICASAVTVTLSYTISQHAHCLWWLQSLA